MIQYRLKCSAGHSFDSWFQSADAYEKLSSSGLIACSVCGDTSVEKAIMAPRVMPARNKALKESDTPAVQENQPAPNLTSPDNDTERMMADLRAHVEANSEDVGANFATEARAMHDGDAPERPIYGEAKVEEAKALIEDGVPVAPLPFNIGRKTN